MKKTFFLILCLFFTTGIWADFNEVESAFHFNVFKLSEDSPISASFQNHPITEADRITISEDGHLIAGGKRIRIFGTNLSTFPKKSDAAFVAQTLANQGYNCIRFHHTDASWTNCFLKQNDAGAWVFSEEGLDRFDYFFAELKKRGIYSNINFLTGRTMSSADGYRKEINHYKEQKAYHALGFWDSFALQNQKEYAAKIINHVNPYTGTAYKDDPAVAIMEVNNENGLMMAYTNSWLEDVDGFYWEELEEKWNLWLKNHNYSYEKLSAAFNKEQPYEKTLINNDSSFYLEQHEGAKAECKNDRGVRTVSIKQNGSESWHVQYNYPNLEIKSDQIYRLKFSIKANSPCEMDVSFAQNHDPWGGGGFYRKLNLTSEYKDYEFVISNLLEDNNMRLSFGSMGNLKGKKIYIKDCTLEKGGAIKNVELNEKQMVKFPHFGQYQSFPDQLKNICMNFLYDLEEEYWTQMKDFIRKENKAQALLMGTIVTCSTPYIQSLFDIIDSHAYWYHPAFPGNSWDNNDFYVWNKSLTKAGKDNTLTQLASQRVFGKPFSVSEYDHPYPNQFSAETYLMLSSFASYQDWDCIFTFCSSGLQYKGGQNQKIDSYFDQTNNPVKSAAAPFASRIFREGLVKPAEKVIYTSVSKEKEKELLYKISAWNVYSSERYNLDPFMSLYGRIGICLNGYIPKNSVRNESINWKIPEIKNQYNDSGFLSDTKELYWNAKEGLYIISNDFLTLTVAAPGAMLPENLPEWQKKGRLLPFTPQDDFISCAGIFENNQYIIFSASWSGNKDEHLRSYGQKPSKGNLITRDEIKLTSDGSFGRGPALALASNAKAEISGQKSKLMIADMSGKATESNKKQKVWQLNNYDGSLWYILSFDD